MAPPQDSLNPTLAAGLGVLSANAEIEFTQYIRYVLPIDGYVFWLATQKATIQGSLHYDARSEQNADESFSVNRVVFTTTTPIQYFDAINPEHIWVGAWDGIKFAFSSRGYLYPQASIYHYVGDAVYPVMESQLIDLGAQLDPRTRIVSNSLPAWLAIRGYAPEWLVPDNPGITLYPSFLLPDNLRPPYGAVDIIPQQTLALGVVPRQSASTGSTNQLATDHVKVTLYGLTNDMAADWLQTALRFMEDGNGLGLMSMPIIRDEKRTQVELNILAQKKTIEFDVSYQQLRMDNIALQLIESAAVAVNINGEL